MTLGEFVSRLRSAGFRDDTELLGMRVRGTTLPPDLIAWVTPRTTDPERHTVGIVMSPDFGDRR